METNNYINEEGTQMKILDVQNFSKSYDDLEVIHNISFSINKGDMFAILGVNGAGKTTLLECIEGLRPYNAGVIDFCNSSGKIKNLFGVQLQSSSLPENITIEEIIKLLCLWNNNHDYDTLISLFNLNQIKNQKYKTLSTGQKRKLHLVLSLVNDSDILFLDEPTAGLDVEARAEFHQMLIDLNKAGKTIIFSSHDMNEVESLCNQMILLKDGEIRYLGSILNFKKTSTKKYKAHIQTIESNDYVTHEFADYTNGLYELILDYKSKNQIITDLKIEQPSLEDVFLKVAKEKTK